jgi:hypothetical protein
MQTATILKYINLELDTIVVSVKLTGALSNIMMNPKELTIYIVRSEIWTSDAIIIKIAETIEQTNSDLK